MKNKKVVLILLSLILIITNITNVTTAYADETSYKGYNYNNQIKWMPSPNAYLPSKIIKGLDLGIGDFNSPQDVFIDKDKNVYVLDSGNNRVVILDKNLQLKKVIDKFVSNKGNETLNDARGIFVSKNNEIFIADRGNARVIILDEQGKIKNTLLKPETDLLPENFNYQPEKVLQDNNGMIYVLATGLYQGAVNYDEKGRFCGFYGSNKINKEDYFDQLLILKKIMSKKQREKLTRFVPMEFSNFDVDNENFIYTSSRGLFDTKGLVKKINAQGKNLFEKNEGIAKVGYGDLQMSMSMESETFFPPSMVDINVDDRGFVNALDFTKGRIFQYDQRSNLLCIFGGRGDQEGLFKMPVAIDNMEDNILVLDAEKANITVFTPTDFGMSIREGVTLYDEGFYDKAITPWKKVLGYNNTYDLAHIGMGKAYLQKGQYEDAMKCFKLGFDKESYSEAYKDHRKETVRRNFLLFSLINLALIIAVVYLIKKKNKNRKKLKQQHIDIIQKKYKLPLYTMFHPLNGYKQLKVNKGGSMPISILILFLWVAVSIFKWKRTGFIFNPNNVEQFNIFEILMGTMVVFCLWVLGNWGFCTLSEGKGKFKEIWIATSYALVPYIIINFIYTVLSNFMIKEEKEFLVIIAITAVIWSIVLLVTGMMVIHEYTMKKTIGSIIISIVGVLIIIFFFILMYSLFVQVYFFIKTIIYELSIR